MEEIPHVVEVINCLLYHCSEWCSEGRTPTWTTECDGKLEAENSERCVDHEIHLLTLVGNKVDWNPMINSKLLFYSHMQNYFILSHTKQRYKYNTCGQHNAGAHVPHTKLPLLITRTTTLWALHISDKQQVPWQMLRKLLWYLCSRQTLPTVEPRKKGAAGHKYILQKASDV